jgi:hypothetical protein
MPIELDCSEGYEFDASFRAQLPALEKAMTDHGIDPSDFVLTKGPSGAYHSYNGGRAPYNDYTVDTGEDAFTVTYADDAGFLEYFLRACLSPD